MAFKRRAAQHCYTDASIKRTRAGLGILWEEPGVCASMTLSVPEHDVNVSEMLAILFGVLYSCPCKTLTVFTDSQVSLDNIMRPRSKFYCLGRAIVHACAARCADTRFVKVKAHSGVPGNESADALARVAASAGQHLARAFPRAPIGKERDALVWYLRACGLDPALTVLGHAAAVHRLKDRGE